MMRTELPLLLSNDVLSKKKVMLLKTVAVKKNVLSFTVLPVLRKRILLRKPQLKKKQQQLLLLLLLRKQPPPLQRRRPQLQLQFQLPGSLLLRGGVQQGRVQQ